MSSEPFTLRWGILGCGGIATTFTKDLLIDPQTRNAHDIRHTVVAAATSSSAQRAQDFCSNVGVPPNTAKGYGSYTDLVRDPDVDIVYIATPHSHHYQHARLVLEAGKHVLIEKPITVNAEQCKELRRLAKEKKRFMMEAVWTRFFPLSREVCSIIQSGRLGTITRVYADFSFWNDVENEFGRDHRMINPELAGGALLDLGIYSLTWVFMACYYCQPQHKEKEKEKPVVVSAVSKGDTGVDETTTVLLHWKGIGAHAVAGTSIRVATTPNAAHGSGDAIRIQGTLGDLTVDYAPRPRAYTLIPAANEKRGKLAEFEYGVVDRFREIPGGGHGMFWEADECARCVRDGKMESEVCGLQETEVLMEVMDQVRRSGGVVYPERICSLEYPLEGFGI